MPLADYNEKAVLEVVIEADGLVADATIAAEVARTRDQKLMWLGMRGQIAKLRRRILGLRRPVAPAPESEEATP